MTCTPVPITVTSNTLDCVLLMFNKWPVCFQTVWFPLVVNLSFGPWRTRHTWLLPMPSLSVLCQLQQMLANYPNPSEFFHFFSKEMEIILDCTTWYLFSPTKTQPQTLPACCPQWVSFLAAFWDVILVNVTIQSPSRNFCLHWVTFHWKTDCFVEV